MTRLPKHVINQPLGLDNLPDDQYQSN